MDGLTRCPECRRGSIVRTELAWFCEWCGWVGAVSWKLRPGEFVYRRALALSSTANRGDPGPAGAHKVRHSEDLRHRTAPGGSLGSPWLWWGRHGRPELGEFSCLGAKTV